ncbi:MAG TPA: sigma 54-interacting transcriptional regulator [Ignavibacteriaceae bacterium]|nr:sigma 54-interacting transcriptional regulator [Ignavibacteriaceae bacterium]
MNGVFFVIIIVVILSTGSYSQQYNIIHYNRSEDKIGNQVWNIYQDSKGYMWFATSSGLARYNGWKYDVFTKESGLLESFVFGIREDKQGNFWIGGLRGISRLSFKNGRNQAPQITNKILGKYNDFYRVFIDSYNRVWAYNNVTASDLFLVEDDSVYNFSEKYKFKDQRVLYIQEHQGKIYILTSQDKIYEFFIDAITEVDLPKEVIRLKPRMFFFNSHDEIILCGTGGVGSVTAINEANKTTVEFLTYESALYALESRYGGYWIATEQNGLLKVDKEGLLNITESNGLPTNYLYTLYEDREGILWIGTGIKGLFKLPSLRFKSFGRNEGFTQGAISSVTISDEGIYCTTENGIFNFREPNFSRIPLNIPNQNSATTNFFFHLMPAEDNTLLLGGADGLYMMSSSGMTKRIGLQGMWVQTLMKDSKGQVWIGTNNGLYRLRENLTTFKVDIDLNDAAVNSIAEVQSRDLYLGTTEGLIILVNGTRLVKPDEIKFINNSNGLLSNIIQDIVVVSPEEIIVGTAEGINILTPEKIDTITIGLSNREIVVLFKDSHHNLWVGTNYGLNKLERKANRYEVVRNYYQKDGLASNEFTRNSTITQDKRGRLLIGTFSGMSIYDPMQDNEELVNPNCCISSIAVNDTIVNHSTMDYNFNYTENKFRFTFEGLTFADESSVRYEYYIFPIEPEWSNKSTTPFAAYNYLEPGEYEFRVRAINSLGVYSNIQAWPFEISPPFWRTWWFSLSMVLLVIILVYAGHTYRTQQIRKRNEQLQITVEDRTSQLRISNEKLEQQYKELLDAQEKLVEKERLEEAFKEIEKLKNRLSVENIYLREKQTTVYEVGSLVGNSDSIKNIRRMALEVAPTNSTVLITGETGTGKTLVGEAIHALSQRKERTLVVVNCAAIPSGLVESELFGHEKGAFTGAHMRREGKFEVADGSTLFLDEIGDMDLHIQSKILTFLQDRKFSRIGGNDLLSVDVRIIAATNYNLEELVKQGKFRKDLFHRLQVFNIFVPPLRERVEDIIPLSKYFTDRISKMMNKNITAISRSAFDKLEKYQFPGNVRELENIIQRAIIVCKGGVITDEDIVLSKSLEKVTTGKMSDDIILSLEDMEKQYIQKVLNIAGGKIAGKKGAAELLGIHPNTLRSRMEKLNIRFNGS